MVANEIKPKEKCFKKNYGVELNNFNIDLYEQIDVYLVKKMW